MKYYRGLVGAGHACENRWNKVIHQIRGHGPILQNMYFHLFPSLIYLYWEKTMPLKRLSLFLLLLLFPSLLLSMPVGNISDPFLLKSSVFKTRRDVGFFISGDYTFCERYFDTREDRTIRLSKENFSKIFLKKTASDGTASVIDINAQGNSVILPTISEQDADGTFTLFMQDGEIVQLPAEIEDSGSFSGNKIDLSYTGIKFGITYKNAFSLYATMGKGMISKHVTFIYNIIETHGITVSAEDPEDETTQDVIDNLNYNWDDQTRTVYAVDRKFKTDEEVIFGGGVSAILAETQLKNHMIMRWGTDLKYRKIDLESDGFSFDGIKYKLDLNEWQAAFAVSLEMNRVPFVSPFTPYLGITGTYVSGTEDITMINDSEDERAYIPYFVSHSDIEIQKNFGWFLGLSWNVAGSAQMNIEKRFNDEDGLYVSVIVKL